MNREDETSHDRQVRLKAGLKRIDADDDYDVSSWEADFLETCIRGFTAGRYLSSRQIDVAKRMIDKYEGRK